MGMHADCGHDYADQHGSVTHASHDSLAHGASARRSGNQLSKGRSCSVETSVCFYQRDDSDAMASMLTKYP